MNDCAKRGDTVLIHHGCILT